MTPWQLHLLAELLRHPDKTIIVSSAPQHPQVGPR